MGISAALAQLFAVELREERLTRLRLVFQIETIIRKVLSRERRMLRPSRHSSSTSLHSNTSVMSLHSYTHSLSYVVAFWISQLFIEV